MPSEVEDGSLQVGRIRAPRQWVEAVSVRQDAGPSSGLPEGGLQRQAGASVKCLWSSHSIRCTHNERTTGYAKVKL